MSELKKLSDEERKNAKEWSEGNNYLYEALCALWENNVRTHACCAGHDIAVRTPYCNIFIDDDSLPYIERIVAALQNMPDIVMSCSFRFRSVGRTIKTYPESDNKSFKVSGLTSNRCELFYKIAQSVQSGNAAEITNPKAINFYKSVLHFSKMSNEEILKLEEDGIAVGSTYSSRTEELMNYLESIYKGNSLLGRINQMPIIKKLFDRFSSRSNQNKETYGYLNGKYGNTQNFYQPKLQDTVLISTVSVHKETQKEGASASIQKDDEYEK